VKRLFALLPLTSLVVAACAGGMSGASAPAPPPFDPSGTYDARVDVEGEVLTASLTISSTSDGYSGSMGMAEVGTIPLTDIVVTGDQMTFWVTNPYGRFSVSLAFEGDKFTGTFESEMMGGYLSGTKRR
jgi:hypothetical protein